MHPHYILVLVGRRRDMSLADVFGKEAVLNESQYNAVELALKQKVTLIQGPPGCRNSRAFYLDLKYFLVYLIRNRQNRYRSSHSVALRKRDQGKASRRQEEAKAFRLRTFKRSGGFDCKSVAHTGQKNCF